MHQKNRFLFIAGRASDKMMKNSVHILWPQVKIPSSVSKYQSIAEMVTNFIFGGGGGEKSLSSIYTTVGPPVESTRIFHVHLIDAVTILDFN